MLTPPGIRLREKQEPPELWYLIWKYVGWKNEEKYNRVLRGHLQGLQPEPFHARINRQFFEDPKRRQAKLAFAASYSTALAVFGPELYKRVFVITDGAMKSLLDGALKAANWTPAAPNGAHVPLALDRMSQKVDWVSTRHAWAGFSNLQTLTICYHPKEPAPLIPYLPIAGYLPSSLQLLRLRPWGEADDLPPQFPQILRGGAKGKVQAFQNIPQIHLQVVVYVVWPPYSKQAAKETFHPWTAQVQGGRLDNISVTLFPPNEGLDIEDAIKELEGDVISEGKKYGYLPQEAEEVEDAVPAPGKVLAYDWRKDEKGDWQVDMDDWGWFASMQ
ncbi:hypothetical protein LXA43DRAFT_1069231 [Ganoderma leucocontextum]|nr:hypothetical protein LXA43DRAFT_1069231 [Ganoderma leucocontextum]